MIRLELADIQGNIYRPYGRFGFPHSRHLFFNFADATEGRRFVQGVRKNVTTAEPWDKNEQGAVKKPPITLNIGFSYQGLRALDLPTRTLRLMPDEFIDGMFCRADILGDAGGSAPEHWDRAWNQPPHELARQVHLWVSLNAAGKADGTPVDEMAQWTTWLESLVAASGGMVTLLDGHGSDGTGQMAGLARDHGRREPATANGAFRLHRRHQRSRVQRPVSRSRGRGACGCGRR